MDQELVEAPGGLWFCVANLVTLTHPLDPSSVAVCLDVNCALNDKGRVVRRDALLIAVEAWAARASLAMRSDVRMRHKPSSGAPLPHLKMTSGCYSPKPTYIDCCVRD